MHAQRNTSVGASLDSGGPIRGTTRPVRGRAPPDVAGSLARYRVLDEIGRGGTAVVLEAVDGRYLRRVAIKWLAEGASRVVRDRFRLEIELMTPLRHPNIVPVFDSGEWDKRPFYVMPLIEGGTLKEQLRRDGPLPWPDAVGLMRQLGCALTSVHEGGVLHLDLKPGNVLLDHGHALLADFGIARRLGEAQSDDPSGEARLYGTPCYMSPEASLAMDLDERADVFGLACLAYECLTGEPPFLGVDARMICARQLIGPAPSVRSSGVTAPRRGDAALRKALAASPPERFSTVSAFIDALG